MIIKRDVEGPVPQRENNGEKKKKKKKEWTSHANERANFYKYI